MSNATFSFHFCLTGVFRLIADLLSFACTKESRQRKIHPGTASDPARRGLRLGRSHSASLRWVHSNFIHEICPVSTPGARDAFTGNTPNIETVMQTENGWGIKVRRFYLESKLKSTTTRNTVSLGIYRLNRTSEKIIPDSSARTRGSMFNVAFT